jgi:uncharacterized membrane protein YebE (DUF533 family)
MNADEISALVRQGVTMLGTSTAASAYLSHDQTVAIAGGAAALVSVAWTLYANWNQRKVHETSVVTATAPTVADAKAASIQAGK